MQAGLALKAGPTSRPEEPVDEVVEASSCTAVACHSPEIVVPCKAAAGNTPEIMVPAELIPMVLGAATAMTIMQLSACPGAMAQAKANRDGDLKIHMLKDPAFAGKSTKEGGNDARPASKSKKGSEDARPTSKNGRSKERKAQPTAAGADIPEVLGRLAAEEEVVDEHPWQRTVAESWRKVRALAEVDKEKKKSQQSGSISGSGQRSSSGGKGSGEKGGGKGSSSKAPGNKPKSFGIFGGFRSSTSSGKAQVEEHAEEHTTNTNSAANLPQTFEEMVMFNAKMIGANVTWVQMVLKPFDTLVVSVTNSDELRLEKETRLLALRMYGDKLGDVKFKEFKVCMLASLRSLLPAVWDTEHEKAWEQMWETMAKFLARHLELPAKYHRRVEDLVCGLSEKQMKALGLAVFKRLFKMQPQTEFYFKQNNERLCLIVRKALEFSAQFFAQPHKTLDELHALALKHIMWCIPTEYFEPFVECCMEEVKTRSQDDVALQGLSWALEVVALVLVQGIEDGSNPLLTAVLKNNPKQVKKELGKLPKNQRTLAPVGGTAM